MKTILVPVDFSDAAANALKYAADFSEDIDIDRIILLKSVYVSVYAQLLPSADFVQLSVAEIGAERAKNNHQLTAISRKLSENCNSTLKIETVISELPLLRSIHQLIEEEKPAILIIGSAQNSDPDDSYLAEHVVEIAKTSTIPVLIVPAGVQYKKIERALVPCDFAVISRLDVLKKIPGSKRGFHPELLVLNVATQQKHQSENEIHTTALKELLENYQYTVYCSEYNNTVKCVLDFADKHAVQLIIALPGRYSFFYSFTRKSIADALAMNARHPVLILK